MSFSSMPFLWVFLPLTLILYFFVDKKYKNFLLLVMSLIFYAWGQIGYLGLLIISILINYFFGFLIHKTNQLKRQKTKKFILIFAIALNIFLLGYHKYANFVLSTISDIFGMEIGLSNLVFPIGISFYTFSNLSYLIDIYRKDARPEKNIINFALYVALFPKLTMGPIEQFKDFNKQLRNRKVTKDSFYDGIIKFGYGLFKKVAIADILGFTANAVFGADLNSIAQGTAWLGAICYSLQLYFDFSGYSDMARGLGKMFGFEISENFNYPYLSTSLTDFWRRWHETLNKWFIKYIYIPLGGNRKGKFRTYLNIGVIFLVTGLWHGAAWNFIVWGLFHGFFVIIERIGLKNLLDKSKIINRVYTLLVVIFGWVLFRASTVEAGFTFIKKMIIPSTIAAPEQLNLFDIAHNKTIPIALIAILFSGFIQAIIKKTKIYPIYKKYFEPVVVLIFIFVSILGIVSGTFNSFIYAQF